MKYLDAREIDVPNGVHPDDHIIPELRGKPKRLYFYTEHDDNGIRMIGECNQSCEHHTKEQAYKHYKDYLMKQPVKIIVRTTFIINAKGHGEEIDVLNPCAVCKTMTNQEINILHKTLYLCNNHLQDQKSIEHVLHVGNEEVQ